ncbi:MAG: CRISPR-associated protein Cas4 [Dehalococcoidia bacterium]
MSSARSDEDFIPLSALQHAVYCMRQAALIHLERLWAENRLTAEGKVLHLATQEPGARRVCGIRRVSSLPLVSHRLGLTGVADLVEFHDGVNGETPYPVELKRGKPKRHRADEVQLCAQALCLEEMTGRRVPQGALFYGETRRRLVVAFDNELRSLTEATANGLTEIFSTGLTPSATYRADRCRACSLLELCRPKCLGRSVGAWRERALKAHLDEQASK